MIQSPTQKAVPQTELKLPKRGLPVTIITSFLGSGKTTLLNHILQDCQDLKVAVLVNEFGDIDMVQLSNGCICCTINDDLVEAVYSILDRNEKVDHLVIETTGVADPLPIALTFAMPPLRNLTQLDSIVTLVDAEAFSPQHFESEAALNQVSYADIIVLNKTDLAAPQQVDSLEAWVREQKWGARILRWSLTGLRPSQNSNILLPLILDTNLFQPERYATAAKAMAETTHNHHDPHCHDHHHHSNHLVNDGFVSMAFESDQPFDLDKFQDWLADDLSENVFRAKGFLWFGDITPRYIFQLSGKRYTLDADQWPTDPKTQLVLIGRELDTPKLQNQLRDCLTS